MGFKDEMKREIRNIMKDAEKEVSKTWKIDFKGHLIEIINQAKEERLVIDGSIVDTKKRNTVLSQLKPYSTLSGTLELADGSRHIVSVKLGGLVKLTCRVKIDNNTVLDDSLRLQFLPWEHKERIVPYIQQQVEIHKKVVDEYLPDEEYLYDKNSPRLTAGLSDHLAENIPTPFFAKKLLKLFEEQINQPSTKTRKATYEKIISDHIASYGNEFTEQLMQSQLDESLVQQEALWLLEHAAHREVVKFAISILGCTDCERYKELLFTLGLHEEFTPYAIFALKSGTSRANEHVWQLAKTLNGWGKITAVEQLEAMTQDIKQWLLVKGCENTIMNEYLAYSCAMKGDLEVALYEESISKDLYDGAGLIIKSLLSEDAPQNIVDYPYASAVLSRFVYHAKMHCQTLSDFYPILEIHNYLNSDEEIWEERFSTQWKQYERNAIQKEIQPFIDDPKWSELAIKILEQEYNYEALEVAKFYKVEVAYHLFRMLEKSPTKSEVYLEIMDTKNSQHITDVCVFAETHLSLSHLSDEEQECLQCIVQDLDQYEGIGIALIQAALDSFNESLQYHALHALKEWTPSNWKHKHSLLSAVKTIANDSKDKEIRQLAKQVLNK